MSEPVYLETLGHIACTAGVSVAETKRILQDIGARPAFVINCIPHYAAEVAGTVIARARGWVDQPAYRRRFDARIEGTNP